MMLLADGMRAAAVGTLSRAKVPDLPPLSLARRVNLVFEALLRRQTRSICSVFEIFGVLRTYVNIGPTNYDQPSTSVLA